MKKKLLWFADHFEELIMGFALVLISVVMFLQVVMRYVFKQSLSWSDELCRYAFIWMIFIGISYAVKRDLHIKVDILEQFFPILKKPFEILGEIVLVAFSVYMLAPGMRVLEMVATSKQSSVAMGMPMWIIYLSLFIGFIMVFVRVIEKYVLRIINKRNVNAGEEEIA